MSGLPVSGNADFIEQRVDEMTVSEILAWQDAIRRATWNTGYGDDFTDEWHRALDDELGYVDRRL